MNRVKAALIQDIHFQWRQGFYYAYMLITLIYIIFMNYLPDSYKPMTAVLIVFSDPSALGFFFIGGIVLLEKGQGVMDHIFVTPLRSKEYIISKVLSLSLLSLLSSSVIHITALGVRSLTFSFILGVLLTSWFFTLIGLGIAIRCRTLNGFFLASMYTTVFMLPLLNYLNVINSIWFYVLPTQATLKLLASVTEQLSFGSFILCIVILCAWVWIGFIWAERSLQLFVTGSAKGEGR
jgi:fluoroquinolone transport system permease protein